MKVERSIEIAAPPERVYEVIMDPLCLERWVTIHAALEEAPAGALERGSRLTQQLELAGRCFTVHWTVVENHRARRVVWEGRGPMRSKAIIENRLTEQDGGTHYRYRNEFKAPFGPLGATAQRVVAGGIPEREALASLENLKRLAESRVRA